MELFLEPQYEAIFEARLLEHNIAFDKKEIPSGVYEIPVTCYAFVSEADFNQADELWSEIASMTSNGVHYEKPALRYFMIVSNVLGIMGIIAAAIFWIDFAFTEYKGFGAKFASILIVPLCWLFVVVFWKGLQERLPKTEKATDQG